MRQSKGRWHQRCFCYHLVKAHITGLKQWMNMFIHKNEKYGRADYLVWTTMESLRCSHSSIPNECVSQWWLSTWGQKGVQTSKQTRLSYSLCNSNNCTFIFLIWLPRLHLDRDSTCVLAVRATRRKCGQPEKQPLSGSKCPCQRAAWIKLQHTRAEPRAPD